MPHAHFHIIPRKGTTEREGEMMDAERKNIALGEGPRENLDPEHGEKIALLVKLEVTKEIQRLREEGDVVVGEEGEVLGRVSERGLKL